MKHNTKSQNLKSGPNGRYSPLCMLLVLALLFSSWNESLGMGAAYAKPSAEGPADLDLDYTNNFYVLLSSSTFYFNYRHTGNVLLIYKYLKQRGIHDDRVSHPPYSTFQSLYSFLVTDSVDATRKSRVQREEQVSRTSVCET